MSASTATAGTPLQYSLFVKREAYLVSGVGRFTIDAVKKVSFLDLWTSLWIEPEWAHRLDGSMVLGPWAGRWVTNHHE